jgi:hypothetical protein
VQELLRVADRFQAGGLHALCLAEIRRALAVQTAIRMRWRWSMWCQRRCDPGGLEKVMCGWAAAGSGACLLLGASVPDVYRDPDPALVHAGENALVHVGENATAHNNIARRRSVAQRCRRGERRPRRAAADLRCDCVQRDAAHTVTLVQALPSDLFAALFAAMNS